ncbi:MAG: ABC transporter ATP-binding protein [Pseudomonadota bacterium]
MAQIDVENLSLFYPLTGGADKKIAPSTRPDELVLVGRRKYIQALRDVSFSVSKGQKVGLVGRNGSGKSTLLRVLGGIYSPTSGRVLTQGKISSLYGMNLGIQPDATGRENIVLRGIIKGWSRRELEARVPEIIDFSELGEFIDLPLRTYSDGMRMRLLFAAATAFSPEILLLDEWIGAGDARFQRKAAERMNSLVDQAGITVIASHNRQLLRNVCELGIWLDRGVMRAFGPIADVYTQMDAHFAQTDK